MHQKYRNIGFFFSLVWLQIYVSYYLGSGTNISGQAAERKFFVAQPVDNSNRSIKVVSKANSGKLTPLYPVRHVCY